MTATRDRPSPERPEWEISGNNGFNDASAPFTTTDNVHYTSQVTLSWGQLQAVLTNGGVVDDQQQTLSNVNVQVTDNFGTFTAPTTIKILDAPPTANFSGVDTTVGTATAVSFTNAKDLSEEEQNAGFTYSFDFYDNGVFETTNTTGIAAVPSDITASTQAPTRFTDGSPTQPAALRTTQRRSPSATSTRTSPSAPTRPSPPEHS